MGKIRIAVAEDVPELARTIRQKFQAFEEIELMFIASNGQEMIEKYEENPVSVVLMDINMPVMNGIDATKKLKSKYPDLKIIMHTVFDEDDKIFESILAGASGYLLKDDKPAKILLSIEESIEGGAPMSVSIASKVLSFIKEDSEKSNEEFNLTSRELQILQRIGKGENYQQIANILFISPKTVRNHIEKIYKKLHVHNKVDAVTVAMKNKLIV